MTGQGGVRPGLCRSECGRCGASVTITELPTVSFPFILCEGISSCQRGSGETDVPSVVCLVSALLAAGKSTGWGTGRRGLVDSGRVQGRHGRPCCSLAPRSSAALCVGGDSGPEPLAPSVSGQVLRRRPCVFPEPEGDVAAAVPAPQALSGGTHRILWAGGAQPAFSAALESPADAGRASHRVLHTWTWGHLGPREKICSGPWGAQWGSVLEKTLLQGSFWKAHPCRASGSSPQMLLLPLSHRAR